MENNNNQGNQKQNIGHRRPHHRKGGNKKNNQNNNKYQQRPENIKSQENSTNKQLEETINKSKISSPSELDSLFDDDFIYFSDKKLKKEEKQYTFTEEELDKILAEPVAVEDNRPKTEIIGIRFKKMGKMYYFDPNGFTAKVGESAIVETARGLEFGYVCLGNHLVPTDDLFQPLKPVVRIATPEDIAHNEENSEKEIEAFKICIEKISVHKLDMKLVDAQYTFDNSKLIFYFTSAGRVDFRDLVKDLASVFKIRIELRQIGIRDEAKLIGGLGICGRPLCCATFLSDFVQVSIKMAKEQNLSLNSNKISGTCGRLMCCLRYEYDTYREEIEKLPPVDGIVETPEGKGTVVEVSPLSGTVKVKIIDKQENVNIKAFKGTECKVLSVPTSVEEKK